MPRGRIVTFCSGSPWVSTVASRAWPPSWYADTSEVLFRLCANTDPARDSTIIKNPSDSLDHAPSAQNIGSHMGLDATRKLAGEGYARTWPEMIRMDEEVQRIVDGLQKKTS